MPRCGSGKARPQKRIDNITRDSDSYRAQNGAAEFRPVLLPSRRKPLYFHSLSVPSARSDARSPSSTLDKLISSREWRRWRRSGNENAAHGCSCAALSSGPERFPGTRCRGCAPSSGCLGFVRTSPDGSMSPQRRARRGCASRLRWERGPVRPVAYSDAVHWRCLSAGPLRSGTGPRVLPSPFLPVSEPGPAWIMPAAGTFMRRRHGARPECMAPPRIARPQPGGEPGRICAGFREMGEEDGCLRGRAGLRDRAGSRSTMAGQSGSLIARRAGL